MEMIAGWIAAGESGSVVGPAGSGRTHLLGFLCHRQDALQKYLPPQADPVALVPVDLNNLPANDAATLYRIILRAFYRVRDRFAAISPTLLQSIADFYLEVRAVQDPFLTQSALDDLLLLFQDHEARIVLVLNRFDHFCQIATPQMMNTLRGLRDSFRETLCYLVGMRQEVIYLPEVAVLGDMYDLLDSHVCRVGTMNEADARNMLKRSIRTAPDPPTESEMTAMLKLSGHFPALMRAISWWWQETDDRPTDRDTWLEVLLDKNTVRYRLEKLWNGLTQEEQLALSEVQKLQVQVTAQRRAASKLKQAFQGLAKQHDHALIRLVQAGLCIQTDWGWSIKGSLLTAYVAQAEGRVRGRIWLDKGTQMIYQGPDPIVELTALQHEILHFLVENPRIKHTRDDLIDNAWPEEEQRDGITPNALQVHIASIRKKIEPNPASPRYLVTWHGRPGGYQFFPEGKPA